VLTVTARSSPVGRRWRQARPDDGGFTLVELAVAMCVFSVVLLVFLNAVRIMAATTARVYASTTVATEGRGTLDLLSRQLGFASAANVPVQVGQNWYLEFESDAVKAGGDPQCTQWRYQPSTALLQYRTWSTVTLVATAWFTLARTMVNDPTTQQPFTLLGSDAGFTVMRVTADLRLKSSVGSIVQSQGQFTLRNSLDAPIPTSNTVCTQLGRP
jgi:prepilin-type N-terminal cleavage/methylation domain-containing protein